MGINNIEISDKGIELFKLGACQDYALFLNYLNSDLDLVFINDDNSSVETSLYHAMVFDGEFYYDIENKVSKDSIDSFVLSNYANDNNFTIHRGKSAVEKMKSLYCRDLTSDLKSFISHLQQMEIDFEAMGDDELADVYLSMQEKITIKSH